jgi:hypothetical protein
MARTIQKKVISDDLLFTDDFDESMLDKIEGELGQSNSPDMPEERVLDFSPDKSRAGTLRGKGGDNILDSESTEPEAFERDLAFSEFEDKSPQDTVAESLKGSTPLDDSEHKQAITKMVSSKKISLFAAAALVLLMITGGLTYLLWPTHKEPVIPTIEIVRHRIVIPTFEQEINFLIFARAQEKRDLLKLDLELDFASFRAHEKFKEKRVYYTDSVYSFLREQSPPDNSVQHWVRILEQDLPTRLKKDHPEIPLNTVRLRDFQRL